MIRLAAGFLISPPLSRTFADAILVMKTGRYTLPALVDHSGAEKSNGFVALAFVVQWSFSQFSRRPPVSLHSFA